MELTDRLLCCVPFCHYTRHNREGFSEWICRRHWMMVPKRWRRWYGIARRRARKFDILVDQNRANSIWDKCKAAAIEAAGGIA